MFFSISFWHRLKSWLMIFLLSLLPGLILLFDWNPKGENEYLTEAERHRWLQDTEAVAQRVKEASDVGFWQQKVVFRFKDMLRLYLEQGNDIATAIEKACAGYRRKGLPESFLQVVYKQNHIWSVVSSNKRIIASDYLLSNLFRQVYKQYSKKPAKLEQKKWQQRIKALFGHMNFPELFQPDMKGQPFSGRIDGKSYGIIWDIFDETDNKNEVCGIFAFFPEEKKLEENLSITRTLKFWQFVSNNQAVYPVFIPLDNDRKMLMHKALSANEIEAELNGLRKNLFKTVKSLIPELENRIRLPGELVGKVFSIAGYNARICSLDAVSQAVVLLLAKPRELPTTLRQTVVSVYFYLTLIIWFLFLVRTLVFRKLPEVKSYYRVMAWFMAFASFPAGLAIGTWSSIIQDFEKFRVEETQKTLVEAIRNIEAGLASIDKRFLEASKNVFQNRSLQNQLLSLTRSPDKDQQIFNSIKESYQKENITIDGVMALYNGGWCFTHFSELVSGRGQLTITNGMATVLSNYLAEKNPEKYASETVPEIHSDKKVTSLASVIQVNTKKNAGAIPRWLNKVSDYTLDGQSFLQFICPVEKNNEIEGLILILWNWNNEFKKRLENLVGVESLKYHRENGIVPDFGIYLGSKSGRMALCRIGNRNLLDYYSQFPVSGLRKFSDSLTATVVVSSARLSDIKFVASIDTVAIGRMVQYERFSAFVFLGSIALLLLIGAAIAEGWIIKPINRFASVLGRMSSGESVTISVSNREDEIGAAQQSLNRMSEWINERENLMKFLSPQVLDIVAEGNFFKAGAGILQEVTILVSDIRSFTTLSEDYPPGQVFEMVNTHLERMADIVQKNAGVVDRYVGDAIWAVFYDPHPVGGKNALRAAMQMMQEHRRILARRSEKQQFLYRTGIGICRGTVLVGVMGESGVRLDFSVVGEALNRAEHLESLSKLSSETGIIFSDNLLQSADELEVPYQMMSGYPGVLEVTGFV